jgi:hypothetical protein
MLMSILWQKLAFRNEMRLAALSLQETLTSLPNIVLLSTGNKATIADSRIVGWVFLQSGFADLSIVYSLGQVLANC